MIFLLTKNEELTRFHKSYTLNYENTGHLTYLTVRIMGINTIKDLSESLKIKKDTMYKAIRYFDKIFLSLNRIDENDVVDKSKICIIIAIKFNEACLSYSIRRLIKKCEISNYKIKEINCLSILAYSLSESSTYDWISSLINNEFKYNEYNILQEVNQRSINLLYELVEDIRFLDFEPKETAIGIIKLTSQLLGIRLELPIKTKLSYSKKCYLVLERIVFKSNLIVFIPKTFLLSKEGIKHTTKSPSNYHSSSTSDSNDLNR